VAQRVLRRDGQHAKAESCDVCRQRFKMALLPLSWADYGRMWLRRARMAWGMASLAGGVVGGCVGALLAVEMIVAVASDVIVSVDGMAADSVLRAVAGTVVRTLPLFALTFTFSPVLHACRWVAVFLAPAQNKLKSCRDRCRWFLCSCRPP
jgi:hypothetical protein